MWCMEAIFANLKIHSIFLKNLWKNIKKISKSVSHILGRARYPLPGNLGLGETQNLFFLQKVVI
jgi:hypothetical protein